MREVAVITGGTKGIGYALLKALAQVGMHLITCSRNEQQLQEVQEQLQDTYSECVIDTFTADMSKKEMVIAFADFIKSRTDRIDLLVNNAGVFIPGQISSEEDGLLEIMMNTNLYSAYHLTRTVLPLMTNRRAGHIFNICSTASITPYINGGSYCISKYALYGMTKVLREELKEHQVKVTAVLPGATLTASWDGVELPAKRFMKADDVAKSILDVYHLSEQTVVEEILLRPMQGDIA